MSEAELSTLAEHREASKRVCEVRHLKESRDVRVRKMLQQPVGGNGRTK